MFKTKLRSSSSNWMTLDTSGQAEPRKGGPQMKRPRGITQRIALPYSFSKRDADLHPFDPLQYLLVSRIKEASAAAKHQTSRTTNLMTSYSTKTVENLSNSLVAKQSDVHHVKASAAHRWSNMGETEGRKEGIDSGTVSALRIQGNQLKDSAAVLPKTPTASKPSFRLRKIASPPATTVGQKRLAGPGPHPMPHLPTTSFTRFKPSVTRQSRVVPAALVSTAVAAKGHNIKTKHVTTIAVSGPTDAANAMVSRSNSPPAAKVRLEMVE